MSISRPVRRSVVAVVACLAGCGTLSFPHPASPLTATPCGGYFPDQWEVRATLSLQKDSMTERFFMALATTGSRPELALLTPQGIPVYRFECVRGNWEVNRQARIDDLVEPERLVEWLQMSYLEAPRVVPLLKPGWELTMDGSSREFVKQGREARVIRVERGGNAPWYASVTLTDSGMELRVAIRVLEASHVLPE